jgi:hypothetical protein
MPYDRRPECELRGDDMIKMPFCYEYEPSHLKAVYWNIIPSPHMPFTDISITRTHSYSFCLSLLQKLYSIILLSWGKKWFNSRAQYMTTLMVWVQLEFKLFKIKQVLPSNPSDEHGQNVCVGPKWNYVSSANIFQYEIILPGMDSVRLKKLDEVIKLHEQPLWLQARQTSFEFCSTNSLTSSQN